jgi:hypothetical protein
MSAKFDLSSRSEMGSRGGDRLLHALRHGSGVATAAGIATLLGRMSKHIEGFPMPFDGSADRQLVELLLAWTVGSEPFCDGVRAMIWASNSRGSAEEGQRPGSSPNNRRNVQIVQSTRKRGPRRCGA